MSLEKNILQKLYIYINYYKQYWSIFIVEPCYSYRRN